jgi:hypothetical protein
MYRYKDKWKLYQLYLERIQLSNSVRERIWSEEDSRLNEVQISLDITYWHDWGSSTDAQTDAPVRFEIRRR